MELHDVSYGIEYIARPLLLFFSSENRLLWFRYREYDLAHLKLIFEFSIYKVWKSVGYGARIRRIFLDGYDMDVKSAFLYGKIEEEVYVCQPPGFEDPDFPDRQKEDGIFISQDKYVTEILKKFGFTNVKTASTPMETQKPLLKDENGKEVMLYRSMIGSLMYLTSSRPDIIYLKGQPKLGLWYPKDSPFDLVAYTDSDYAGASLDRKSTTGGCQFLSCCGQVLWIQNQLLDYGYNFMHTKIYIDNESTICIVKNPVFHLKTKHIEIRHHFIRDSYEKKLIQMIKIHTDQNVADLLTKAFDVSRFQYLIASIGMLNL
ncbi:putative reverse transcriptase, RNA-dependent DNA polymerase [Tanacetum coccineum]